MNWITIVTTIFDVAWLLALLLLLYLIWRSSEARLKHIQNMELAMFDIAKRDAETSQKAVETTRMIIDSMILKDAKDGTTH